MTLTHDIEALRDYPARANDEFRGQIDRVKKLRERMSSDIPARELGVDRSKEFSPIQRPAIVRTVMVDVR